ncbi:MAG: response regulator transcription factor [Abditibacteriales bacterium]|nr:response regulator transcription factor [Abditibacteriales bacterium]MDW8365323.1 response regulator transcription factor [Abditibacteriales bacterium]
MPRIRVLLAEDQPLLRRLMVEHLSRAQDIELVGDTGDGREAVRLAERTRPDVVLLDYDLPLLTGGDAARLIRQKCPQALIVILSNFPSTELPWVDHWLRKDEVEHMSATVYQLVEQRQRARCAAAPSPVQWADLTEGQQNALRLLVTENLSNKEIAARLSQIEHARISESAVKKRLEQIMNKWQVDPRKRTCLVQVALARLRGNAGIVTKVPPKM